MSHNLLPPGHTNEGSRFGGPSRLPVDRKVPPPGRKMQFQEARDYVFKKYAKTFELLAQR